MDKLKKLNGSVKASLTVLMVLALAGTLALLAAEKSERGFLGVSVQRLDSAQCEKLGVSHGVQVVGIEKESAAAKAGIQKKDVIQSINGEKIRDPQSLSDIVRELEPGSAAKIGLWRDGKAQEVKAVLGKYKRAKRFIWHGSKLPKTIRSRAYLGVNLLEFDNDLAAYFSVKTGEGVLISGVAKDSPASKAGLKSGDVIVEMAGKPVKGSEDIHEALAALKKDGSVAITVVRHGKKQTLKAEPDFDRHQRVFRIFSGDKDIEIEHLELPELDIRIPEIIMEPPCPPDMPDVDEITDRVHKHLDKVLIKVDERLKKLGEDYWI
ncbi:MAG TPA: PDZ domain-containing protein [Patescibacteria group bacterium]|nr:PDZ domain-containing protein [Patescibacteria group bacterium]